MANGLMLPSGLAPNNLHLRATVKATFVESDVYDISQRLAAVSPTLHLWQLEEVGHDSPAWAVCEHVHGVEMLVKKYYELDARIIDDMQRIQSVPLEHRAAAAQAEIDAAEAARHQDSLDEMYENVGQRMHARLERDGFIGGRGVSYPKSPVRQRAGR